jgi:hypothetical protein
MGLSRRGFLGGLAGILAAGVAPAAVGSGILMPVRQVIAPRPDVLTYDYGRGEAFEIWSYDKDEVQIQAIPREQLYLNGGLLWQDAARTIPVTQIGQPVGYVESIGVGQPAMQTASLRRPTFGIDERGRAYLDFQPGAELNVAGRLRRPPAWPWVKSQIAEGQHE